MRVDPAQELRARDAAAEDPRDDILDHGRGQRRVLAVRAARAQRVREVLRELGCWTLVRVTGIALTGPVGGVGGELGLAHADNR